MSKSRIIVSLDYADSKEALAMVSRLDSERCKLKVGKELFTVAGPRFVDSLVEMNFDVFLDLKYHDIPNTVAKACAAASSIGVWMLNVHASGGSTMMTAAREAIDKSSHTPLLIAVTVLTSMAEEDLTDLGLNCSVEEQVQRLAKLAQLSGADGVVCSAKEVSSLRQTLGPEFKLVTPGIRPSHSSRDDQKRVMTPAQAIANGSDYLVIGRPVTQAEEPMQVLADIENELASIQRSQ